MPDYVSVTYNKDVRPVTQYPSQLCWYLFDRFRMKKGQKILDVGCGRGDFSKGFKDLGLEVYGLDREKTDSDMLNGINVQYADLETEKIPLSDATFDIIFSKSVIEHFFNPENFMKECYRVLKPGGKIIIMTPDWLSQMKIFYHDYTHRTPFNVDSMRDILLIFGFKQVTSERFYQLPIIWKLPPMKIISKFISLFVPVTLKSKIKFIRWSVELMVLGYGEK